MFGSLGAPELIVIFIVALVVFGPSKLPELGKSLGEAIRFVANAYAQYDVSAVAITPRDPSIPRLGSLEVKALWREYGERLTRE